MPKDSTARRYQSPEKRGYGRIYVSAGRKDELDAAARLAGFKTTDDYLWHLHQAAQQKPVETNKAGA